MKPLPSNIAIAQCILSPDDLQAQYSGRDGHRTPGYRSAAVSSVEHLNPAILFSLESFTDPARVSFGGFLNRYNHPRQTWMRDQRYYLERAVLAAAYECMLPEIDVAQEGSLVRLNIDEYDGLRFLKCGRANRHGSEVRFHRCEDVCRCPSCNKNMRLLPARREFLPGFPKFPCWYGIGPSSTNNPETAGVHLEIGRDESGQPIYDDLFLLSQIGTFRRLPRFSADNTDAVMTTARCIFDFSHWLTRNAVFGGIGLVGDVKFSFFPDRSRLLGCGHSILVHGHGFGNTPRPLSADDAMRIYRQYLKMLIKEGGGRLVAYPDIYLTPCPTATALRKAIDYAIKPFKLPQFYIEGLNKGCPVEGLNWEFHQVAWTCEQMFPGADKHLAVFGNMHVNSPDYDFVRQYRKMTRAQLADFLERLASDDVTRREVRRYEEHQMAVEQARLRRLEQARRNVDRTMPMADQENVDTQ